RAAGRSVPTSAPVYKSRPPEAVLAGHARARKRPGLPSLAAVFFVAVARRPIGSRARTGVAQRSEPLTRARPGTRSPCAVQGETSACAAYEALLLRASVVLGGRCTACRTLAPAVPVQAAPAACRAVQPVRHHG